MKGRRVFVTGGAGVIGLEMIPLLAERGAEVLVGDLKPRPACFPATVAYRMGDLNDLRLDEIADFSPEIIIHLAATFERSAETYEFWEQNFRHNLRLSHHLMSLAKDLPDLARVVFASSYLIYDPKLYQFSEPQARARALGEEDAVLPRNLTGMAKLAHEVELRFLAEFRSAQFSSACARIFRGYGRNSRDIVSRWIRALLAGEEIAVYRPEGTFDYVYARDSAEGLIRLAEAGHVSGIVNLGTGRARKVREIVDLLRVHFPDMKAREEPSDIAFEASEADMARYEAAIGWRPRIDLETAIPEIIAHERGRAQADAPAAGAERVLVTSASTKVPLVRAVREAARKIDPDSKVIAGDLNGDAIARYAADEFWRMPPTDDSSFEELLAECRARRVTAIVPTRDGELLFWAKHSDRLAEAGIAVIASPADSIETCLDKLAFAEFGIARGLPFIPAASDPDSLGHRGSFVVKERFGAGSLAVRLDVGRDEALAHGASLDRPIYQPFVAGDEISVDAWLDRGHRVRGLVLRRRDQVSGGESKVTTTFRDERIEGVVGEVLSALGLSGPVVLQAILAPGGGLHIIECNSRFGGASTLSLAVGLDAFYWSLLERRGADPEGFLFRPPSRPIRQVRVPADIYVHDPDL
jgi:carbamoyl-phosphate synthase large subunit